MGFSRLRGDMQMQKCLAVMQVHMYVICMYVCISVCVVSSRLAGALADLYGIGPKYSP